MTARYVETRNVSLADLTPFPGNARRGNVALIAESIERNGQYRSLVVRQTGDGTLIVLAGNHTLQSLARMGRETARCEIVLCDDATATRINLVDNKAADDGDYDEAALAALISTLGGDLEGTGFSDDEAAQVAAGAVLDGMPLLTGPADPLSERNADEQPPPPPPADPVTVRGDVWLLGPHRIMCGDCRDLGDVKRLLSGVAVNIAFTSPPYASQRTYDESSGFRPIPPDEYADWFEDVQANVRAHLTDDGSWFVNIKEHCDDGQRHLYVKDLTTAHVRRWGWRFVDEFAWTRGGVPGTWPNRFKNGWEPVFHFALTRQIKFRPYEVGHASENVFHEGGRVSGTNTTGNVGWSGSDVHTTSGIALPSNVLDIHTNPASMQDADHPAAYPLALPEWFIKAYTDARDVVFDPFMGSGSTLLAAHRNDRVAYGTEISPGYCDVICRRFQQVTGITPVKESTGLTHDFTPSAQEEQR